MRLLIHDNLPLSDLQERFGNSFPGLTLRFYRHPHGYRKGSEPDDQLDPKTLVRDARSHSRKEGQISILSTDTVCQVENLFRDEYGLYVQVIRLESGCSIQTTQTDKYTLGEQMSLVCHLEKSVLPQTKEQIDEYDDL